MSSGFTSLRSTLPRVRDARTGARINREQTSADEQPASERGRRLPVPVSELPRWFRTGEGFRLEEDNPCKCSECHGAGSHSYEVELAACQFCRNELAACMSHRCRMCDGSGQVCPRCRGMRFLRVSLPTGAVVARCDWCCEGNQVSPAKERREIIRYHNMHPRQDTATGSK
jgi:hypothetical protein